jgi:serine/threonine protein kinase
MALPASLIYQDRTYPFARFLGRGGSGSVGLYGDEARGLLVLKMSYCGRPDAAALAAREAEAAQAVASGPACGAVPSADLVRAPLATSFREGCAYALYDFVPENLTEWLQRKRKRRPDEVAAIFLQVYNILICLKARGFYYNDLKPSNLLVAETPAGPRVRIGDLGGIDRDGAASITVTKSRLPPSLVTNLGWDRVGVLGAFLLGELTLQLLLRPPDSGERNVMNDYLSCLQAQATDACGASLFDSLSSGLAEGLALSDPLVRDLAAFAVLLLGYRGLAASLEELPALSSAVFRPA